MKNEDLWNLAGYSKFRKPAFNYEDMEDEDFSDIEEEIKPEFNLNREIIRMLADVRRELTFLARNLETEEDIERTRDALIALQDKIDDIVSEYALSCVDDYVFG